MPYGENVIYVIGTLAYFAIAGLVKRLLRRLDPHDSSIHGLLAVLWPLALGFAVTIGPCVFVYNLAAGKEAWK